MRRRAVFIDKDGTLINNEPYNVRPSLIRLADTVIEGLEILQKKDYLLIVVSNQSGVALGYFNEEDLIEVNKKINYLLNIHNIFIDAFYYCPHLPEGFIKQYSFKCNCRKPAPGMLLKAADDFSINLSESWMIGDILNDVEAGKSAGCNTILIEKGNETEWQLNESRNPDCIVKNFKEAAEFIIDTSNVYD